MNFFAEEEWRCVSMDPPWAERGGGVIKRGADRHYPLMNVEQILATIKASGKFQLAEHAHVWCWVTDSFLRDGLWLLEQLGVEYKRTFAWVKVRVDDDGDVICSGTPLRPLVRYGIGQYGRGAHELLLFATHGKGQDPSVWTERRDGASVVFAPTPVDDDGKRIHSRKPVESYELIESISKGPRLEMFARVARHGWSVWGNEAPELT